MLDSQTKRKIDSARSILVGKVPDPKAQVEQITTALVYKFMDDMDKEAQEIGGKARFFSDGFEKYSWSSLLDPKLSGQNRLDLYVEAITHMSQNPHIPQLFRDIFKDAYLPYRDAQTLSLFLKEINEFTYEHSEKLGDAFEYLLSVLGSQGDAGQFRTPRHIIDFMVEIVDPKKDDTILDPACGTAGFLISAYKHILKQHDGLDDPDHKEKPLTPDEKKRLMNNIFGYDISPDMVRISLVNMYLHGFPKPNISEYDTLTRDDHWDEEFDVVLANPPFMSPKGGIRPHKRFAISANRAELLFVDYIAEHLSKKGSGAIIIPDGIVSNKSSKAYVDMRKKLVDSNYVYGVVSLHPGVFKPYADVKTSILLLDKDIASKTNGILFVDVNEDGYEKGNRKRPIEKNDLPAALEYIRKFKDAVSSGNESDFSIDQNHGMVIPIDKISEDTKYVLRANKYRSGIAPKEGIPMELLGNHIEEVKKRNDATQKIVFSVSNEHGLVKTEDYFSATVSSQDLSNYKVVEPGDFAYNPARANVGSIALNAGDVAGLVSPMYTVFRVKGASNLVPEYLLYLLKSTEGIRNINQLSAGAVRQILGYQELSELEIPIAPTGFQSSFTSDFNLTRNAKEIASNYHPYIKIEPSWEKVKLTDCFTLDKGPSPIQKTNEGEYPLVATADSFLTSDHFDFEGEAIVVPLISSAGHGKASLKRIYHIDGKYAVGNILMVLRPKREDILARFYFYLFSQEKYNMFTRLMYGSTNVSYSIDDCNDLEIVKPTVAVQQEILEKINSELKLINLNLDLVKKVEDNVASKIAEVWGE